MGKVKEKAGRFLEQANEAHEAELAQLQLQEAQKRKEMQDVVDGLQTITQEKTEQLEQLQAGQAALNTEVEEKRALCAEVSDTLHTLQETIQSLKEEKKGLQQGVAQRDAELEDLRERQDRERAALSSELKATHQELAAQQAEHQRFKKVNKSALSLRDQQLTSAKEDLQRRQEQLDELEKTNADGQVDNLHREVRDLQLQLAAKDDDVAAERRRWHREIEEIRGEAERSVVLHRAHMEERVSLLKEEHHMAQQDLRDTIEVDLVAGQLRYEEALTEIKRERDRFRDNASASARRVASAEQEVSTLTLRLDTAAEDLAVTRKQVAQLSASPLAQQKNDELLSQLEQHREDLSAAEAEAADSRDELVQCKRNLLEVQTELDRLTVQCRQSERKSNDAASLTETNKSLQAEVSSLKEELKKHRAKLSDTTNDMYLKSIIVQFLVCAPGVRAAVLPILVQLLALSPTEVKEIFSNNPEWMPH
eukprot:TRINITY_DN14999_c0_g1_i1.p1 TRINITY_DN14999_c0_g1~~TRINITY_DN14999_c0_g1_i1.p1  ORF type:complete len:524 (+),score=263.86 TRINITY_DN14999_c0_g1_i1:136-1572(+)